MSKQMYAKFEKYWSRYSLILAIALVFDPRYKLQFVGFSYKKLYGENSDQYVDVRQRLFALFDEYMRLSPRRSSSNSSFQGETSSHSCDNMDYAKESLDVFLVKDKFYLLLVHSNFFL